MTSNEHASVGSISWTDLTVPQAEEVLEFYKAVVGWKSSPVKMDGYQDHCVSEPESGRTVAGICHAQGVNADLPPQWLIYITVEDLDESLRQCAAGGGAVLHGPRDGGNGRMAVIQDPSGAVAGLFQHHR